MTKNVKTKPKVEVLKTAVYSRESGPHSGHTVVQFPLQQGLGGGGPSYVGFDCVSCCSKYKIRVLCELEGGRIDTRLCWDIEECNQLFCQQTPVCMAGTWQWCIKCLWKEAVFVENICLVFTNCVTNRALCKNSWGWILNQWGQGLGALLSCTQLYSLGIQGN